MRVVIDISEYDKEWIGNAYGIPQEINTKIAEAIINAEPCQPEIVMCKDCKHHWTHKCMDSMPIERCDLEQTFYDAEVDYCSLAERREDG